MLEYLIRNAGRVVTKTELIDHVWDSAADVTPNTVEVYAGYLRRKIGTDRLMHRTRGRLPAGRREPVLAAQPAGPVDDHRADRGRRSR